MQPPPLPITRIPFVIFPCRRCRRDHTTEGMYKKAILPGRLRVAEFKRLLSGRRALLSPNSDQHVVYTVHTDTQLTVLTRLSGMRSLACTFLWISYFVYIALPAIMKWQYSHLTWYVLFPPIWKLIIKYTCDLTRCIFLQPSIRCLFMFPTHCLFTLQKCTSKWEYARNIHWNYTLCLLLGSWHLSDCRGN